MIIVIIYIVLFQINMCYIKSVMWAKRTLFFQFGGPLKYISP